MSRSPDPRSTMVLTTTGNTTYSPNRVSGTNNTASSSSATQLHVLSTTDAHDARVVLQPSTANRIWFLTRSGHVVVRDRSLKEFKDINETATSGNALSMISVEGTVWIGFASGAIKVFDSRTCRLMKEWTRHASNVTCFAYFRGYVASGGSDFEIFVWDVSSCTYVAQLSGHSNAINTLLGSATMLVSGSADQSLRVWSTDNAFACTHVLVGNSGSVNCLLQCRERFWVGHEDGTIRVFEASTLQVVTSLVEHTTSVRCLAVLDREVLSAGVDEFVCIWDAITLTCLKTVSCHAGYVSCIVRIVISPTQTELWTVGNDRKIKCWGKGPSHNSAGTMITGRGRTGNCLECLALQNDITKLQREAQKQIRTLYENMRTQLTTKSKVIEKLTSYVQDQQQELIRQREIFESFQWHENNLAPAIDAAVVKQEYEDLKLKFAAVQKQHAVQQRQWQESESHHKAVLADVQSESRKKDEEIVRLSSVAKDADRRIQANSYANDERVRIMERQIEQLTREVEASKKYTSNASTAMSPPRTRDVSQGDGNSPQSLPTVKADAATKLSRFVLTLSSLVPVLKALCDASPPSQFESEDLRQIAEYTSTISHEIRNLIDVLAVDNATGHMMTTGSRPSSNQVSREAMEDATSSMEMVQQRCMHLEDELREITASNDQVVRNLHDTINQKENDFDTLKEVTKDLTIKASQLEDDLMDLRNTNMSLRQRLEKYETEEQARREEVARLKHELDLVRTPSRSPVTPSVEPSLGRSQPRESEINYLKQSIEVLTAEKVGLESQVSALTEVIKKGYDSHWESAISGRMKPSTYTQTPANKELETMKETLQQRERELNASADVISRLEDEKQAVQTEFKLLEGLIETMSPTADPEAYERLNEELTSLKKMYQQTYDSTLGGQAIGRNPPAAIHMSNGTNQYSNQQQQPQQHRDGMMTSSSPPIYRQTSESINPPANPMYNLFTNNNNNNTSSSSPLRPPPPTTSTSPYGNVYGLSGGAGRPAAAWVPPPPVLTPVPTLSTSSSSSAKFQIRTAPMQSYLGKLDYI